MDVLQILDKKQNELVRFTQSLIRINSCGGNETEVCKVIQKKLNQYAIKSKLSGFEKVRMNLGCKIRGKPRIKHGALDPSVLRSYDLFSGNPTTPRGGALVRGKGRKTLLLCGHTDTVPAGDLSKWKYPPFSGKLVSSKIFGRGALDMKGGIASQVLAVCALRKADVKLDGNLSLLFTFSEEAGMYGIKYALKKGLKADACLIAEPKLQIGLGCRGLLWLEIKTLGKSVHAGNLHARGINATLKMAQVLLVLKRIKLKYNPDRLYPLPKITPGTIISGGQATNIYPDVCCALVDCRLVKGQTDKTVLNDIWRVIKKLQKKDKELKIKIKKIHYVPPTICRENERIVRILKENYKRVFRTDPEIKVSGYTSDANFLNTKGIPSVTFGPDGENYHSENEFVYVKSLLDCAKVYALTIMDFLT